jgi:hypothetical protein
LMIGDERCVYGAGGYPGQYGDTNVGAMVCKAAQKPYLVSGVSAASAQYE